MDVLLGIDVSKKTLDAKLSRGLGAEESFTVSRQFRGFQKLLKAAQKAGDTLYVCMEATGSLWKPVAQYFYEAGATVFVVNPARIKAQRKTEQTRTKTDRVDAAVILRFLRANIADLHVWNPPSPAVSLLQDLVRFRQGRVAELVRLKNLLKSKHNPPAVLFHTRREMALLEDIIAQLDRQIQEVIDREETMRRRFKKADSVTGIGPITAAVLIAECRNFAEVQSPRQATAFAGLDVIEETSGQIKKPPRISKQGSALLRKSFVCAAGSAIRSKGVFRDFYQKLRQRGFKKKSALTAVARKLLEVTVAVTLSDGDTKFECDYRRAA